MSTKTLLSSTKNISKIATFIIFLALIRCIAEPFRLQYYSANGLTLAEIKPFLVGSLVCAIALLVMTILFYVGKYKMNVAICILTIIILLIVKWIYLTP